MRFSLLITTLAILLFSIVSNAQGLLRDCEDISVDLSYRPLQKYISTRDESNEFCQYLAENEFVYTTNDNFYYCKSDNGASLKCEFHDKGVFFPELSLIKSTPYNASSKFVIFRTRRMDGDAYIENYFAFYLVSKKLNPRGYVLFLFPDAGTADRNEGSGKCVNTKDADVISMTNPAVEVIGDEKNNVSVRFNQVRTTCKTNEKLKQILVYSWQDGHFQRTQNLLESISKH